MDAEPFDRPFFLTLNLAIGGNIPGNDISVAGNATGARELQMLVDWIRVYSATPPGTNTPTETSGSEGAAPPAAGTGGLLHGSVAPQRPGMALRWGEEFNAPVLNQVSGD